MAFLYLTSNHAKEQFIRPADIALIWRSYLNMARGKGSEKVKGLDEASPIASNDNSNNRTRKIDPTSLATLVAAILSAIVTAVSTVTAAVPPATDTPSTKKYSSAINLYNTQSFTVNMKDGKVPVGPSHQASGGRKTTLRHCGELRENPQSLQILNNSIRARQHHASSDNGYGRCGDPPLRPSRHWLLESRPWHPPECPQGHPCADDWARIDVLCLVRGWQRFDPHGVNVHDNQVYQYQQSR